MMKNRKRYIAALLAAVVAVGTMPLSVFAEEADTENINIEEENTSKEEVVYINLNSDGSVKEINVVNIFDLEENGKIIDYGSYESLRNMTTTDEIKYENDVVTIDAKAGKLYCEGRLKESAMPWDIAISYYMDGKEYTAEEIAGKSGELEIKMSVRNSNECDSSFFEGYALQITFVLDTNNASDIKADGATIANVGSDKQITYTILPNNERDISISASVSDFEMEGIAINGVRMNMSVEIDDSELQGKIDEAVNAVNDLDKGAGELSDGAGQLYSASEQLSAASIQLYSGTAALYNGAVDLKNGLTALTAKNSELTNGAWSAYEALCSAAQTQLNAVLTAIGFPVVTLTPEIYSDVLSAMLIQITDENLYAQIAALKSQLDSYGEFYSGLTQYVNGVSQIKDGANELADGMSELYVSIETVKNAIGGLNVAVGTLKDGAGELKEGTAKFAEEISGMETQVSDEISSITASITGSDVETVSFVSEQNVNIEAVQFIIKTDAIEKEETVKTKEKEEEELSLWQKFLNLFGL